MAFASVAGHCRVTVPDFEPVGAGVMARDTLVTFSYIELKAVYDQVARGSILA